MEKDIDLIKQRLETQAEHHKRQHKQLLSLREDFKSFKNQIWGVGSTLLIGILLVIIEEGLF